MTRVGGTDGIINAVKAAGGQPGPMSVWVTGGAIRWGTSNIDAHYAKCKAVGHVKGATYYSHRDEATHLCIRHAGYGVQQTLLKALVEQGITTIVLTVKPEAGGLRAYRTPIMLWKWAGTVDDLGEGVQVFVSTRQLQRATDDPVWAGDLIRRIKAHRGIPETTTP